MYDVTIIGCGVIGASLAYTLSRYQLRVLVLEKENDVAMGTTKANSAVVHAGYDPAHGTLMAKLNVRGSAMMEELCRKLSVKYKRTGVRSSSPLTRRSAHIWRKCWKTATKTVCRGCSS